MDHRATLRRLTVRDDSFVEQLLAPSTEVTTESGLDRKTRALVMIGALVAVGAGTPSYLGPVEDAADAGATADEIVGALMAVTPIAGAPRVVAAAPRLGLALGYDVVEALESVDAPMLGR